MGLEREIAQGNQRALECSVSYPFLSMKFVKNWFDDFQRGHDGFTSPIQLPENSYHEG